MALRYAAGMIHRIVIAVLLAVVGCNRAPATPAPAAAGGAGPGPFGPPVMTAVMQPFQGAWRFNLAKTLAQWQAEGATAAQIAEAKKLAAAFPLHPDMSITGDTAVPTLV